MMDAKRNGSWLSDKPQIWLTSSCLPGRNRSWELVDGRLKELLAVSIAPTLKGRRDYAVLDLMSDARY